MLLADFEVGTRYTQDDDWSRKCLRGVFLALDDSNFNDNLLSFHVIVIQPGLFLSHALLLLLLAPSNIPVIPFRAYNNQLIQN